MKTTLLTLLLLTTGINTYAKSLECELYYDLDRKGPDFSHKGEKILKIKKEFVLTGSDEKYYAIATYEAKVNDRLSVSIDAGLYDSPKKAEQFVSYDLRLERDGNVATTIMILDPTGTGHLGIYKNITDTNDSAPVATLACKVK